MKTAHLLAALTGLSLATFAVAQDHAAAPPRPRPQVQPNNVIQEAAQVKFEPIAGQENGRTITLDGVIDVYALHRNPLIDEAAWAKLTPALTEWMADVDQAVIDNLDFIEKLDGGILHEVKIDDMNGNRMVMEMMMQFLAIGPATTILGSKGAMTKLQEQVNTNITNEYLQRHMDEIGAEAQKEAQALPENERESMIVNARSRFIFGLMWRDAQASWARQLDEAAPNLAGIVAQMSLDAKTLETIAPAMSAVKDAQAGAERRKVIKAVLAGLTFDKRRELLTRAREAAPPFNPRTAFIPPKPVAAAPAPADAALGGGR
ncbi:MAG: hypothetical protein ACKVU4_08485 [Phycisphaerales bacterium]